MIPRCNLQLTTFLLIYITCLAAGKVNCRRLIGSIGNRRISPIGRFGFTAATSAFNVPSRIVLNRSFLARRGGLGPSMPFSRIANANPLPYNPLARFASLSKLLFPFFGGGLLRPFGCLSRPCCYDDGDYGPIIDPDLDPYATPFDQVPFASQTDPNVNTNTNANNATNSYNSNSNNYRNGDVNNNNHSEQLAKVDYHSYKTPTGKAHDRLIASTASSITTPATNGSNSNLQTNKSNSNAIITNNMPPSRTVFGTNRETRLTENKRITVQPNFGNKKPSLKQKPLK